MVKKDKGSSSEEDKRLTREMLKANLKNTERELESIGYAMKETEEKRLLLLEQKELRQQMHTTALKNFKPLNPAWEFQRDPEYVELQRRMSDNEFKFKMYEMLTLENQVNSNLKSFREQLDSQEKAKEMILSKIKETEE